MARAQATAVGISLAQEVEKVPILWDATQDMYRRADLKPEAWEKVAASVNVRHKSQIFSGETAKKRFKDLKENFSKNHRKVKESQNKCSGSGYEDVYRPTWPVYKYLLYLSKSCAQAESTSNLPSPDETPSSDSVLADPTVNFYYDDNLQQFLVVPEDSRGDVQPTDSPEDSVCSSLFVPQGPASDPLPGRSSASSFTASSFTASSFTSSSSSEPRPPTSSGVPKQAVKRPAEDSFFNKKGEGKKSQAGFLAKAVQVLEKIADEPAPKLPAPAAVCPEAQLDGFSLFILQRLKDMDRETRRQCENDLMDVLKKY